MRKLWFSVLLSYVLGIYFFAVLIDKFSHYGLYIGAMLKKSHKMYFFYPYPIHQMSWIYSGLIFALIAVYARSGHGDWIMRFFVPIRKPLPNLQTETALVSTLPDLIDNEILANANIKPIKVQFWVQESPEPNAFAWGKNNICMSTAILEHCNDDQIHAVMLHELGHLVHLDTRLSMTNLYANAVFASFERYIMGTIQKSNSNFIVLILGMFFLLPMFVPAIICMLLIWINKQIFAFSSRAQEYAADKFSANLGGKAGLTEFLEMLSAVSYKQNPIIQSYFESHPSPRERIAKLNGYN